MIQRDDPVQADASETEVWSVLFAIGDFVNGLINAAKFFYRSLPQTDLSAGCMVPLLLRTADTNCELGSRLNC